MGAKKETSKQRLQRICKDKKIKFQQNDTISMLLTSLAYELGLNPEGLNKKDLQQKVNNALDKSNNDKADLKPDNKKEPSKNTKKNSEKKEEKVIKTSKPQKKDGAKKDLKSNNTVDSKNLPKTKASSNKSDNSVSKKSSPSVKKSQKNTIKVPSFKNIQQMKEFCVKNQLNKVDGYIMATKSKKTLFSDWINQNIDKASPISPDQKNSNPHSPSAGIGEMPLTDPIEAAKNAMGITNPSHTSETGKKPKTVEIPAMDIPAMRPSDNTNEPPTALTENPKKINFKPDFNNVEELDPSSNNNEMEQYGNSIIYNIKKSYEVDTQGHKYPRQKFIHMINNKVSKLYQYEIKYDDGIGVYLMMSDSNGNTCRIPKEGYLPVE